MVNHSITRLLVACLLASACWAEARADEPKNVMAPVQLVDYEQQVREAAQRTADEAKAKKAQERIERAKTSHLNLVPSATAPIVSAAPQGAEPASKPTSFSNMSKASTAEAGGFRVFKYRKDGATVFADSAPYKTHYEVVIYNSCYACSITSNVNWYNTRLRLTEFADTINNSAKQYGVNPGFVRAIIHAESAFNPLARSRKGAMGLMQLMPGTAKDMGVMDLTNPEQNIKGGVRYLAGLLQTFSGNETLAAAAYNAGPGAVTRYGGIPPYEETQTYVKRVKILADRYKNQAQLAAN